MTQIDDVVADTRSGGSVVVLNNRKRKVTTRPSNWRIITEHINKYGLDSSVEAYDDNEGFDFDDVDYTEN